jgi:predicted house-cleaning noncanonical NTP pyrophosphatase (MazG superfamily)
MLGSRYLGEVSVTDMKPACASAGADLAMANFYDAVLFPRNRAYRAALLDKLDEESAELRHARNSTAILKEAADVLEVLISIVESRGHTLDDLLHMAAIKRAERGGSGTSCGYRQQGDHNDAHRTGDVV